MNLVSVFFKKQAMRDSVLLNWAKIFHLFKLELTYLRLPVFFLPAQNQVQMRWDAWIMKRIIRNTAILISPFLLMIVINEIVRPTIKEEPYSRYGTVAMNSDDKIANKCTWHCQNNTGYCKENHVKYLMPHFKYTDTLYFGMIHMLQSTKRYEAANIVFLVVLIPLLTWILLIKSLHMQDEIKAQKKKLWIFRQNSACLFTCIALISLSTWQTFLSYHITK